MIQSYDHSFDKPWNKYVAIEVSEILYRMIELRLFRVYHNGLGDLVHTCSQLSNRDDRVTWAEILILSVTYIAVLIA